MKLYSSFGPNPLVVRVFLDLKGITIPTEKVDLRDGENRKAPHLLRNPHGQTPVLELDDGSFVSEITAICEYIEERFPAPALIGANAAERAECRMWTRRLDLNICEPLANGYRFGEGNDFFKSRIFTAPASSPTFKAMAQDRLQWLDGQMMDERQFVCGDRFTLADILLTCFLTFFEKQGQPLDRANSHVTSWILRARDRCRLNA